MTNTVYTGWSILAKLQSKLFVLKKKSPAVECVNRKISEAMCEARLVIISIFKIIWRGGSVVVFGYMHSLL